MVQRRYGALRFVAFVLHVLAWVSLILGLLGALGVFLAGAFKLIDLPLARQFASPSTASIVAGVVGGVAGLLAAAVHFVAFLAASQWVILLIDTEQNTRTTTDLLQRLLAAQTFAMPLAEADPTSGSAVSFNDQDSYGQTLPSQPAEPTITTRTPAPPIS